MISSSTGSPAEKADLEVADEILEINGQALEESTHTDVIAHIHNVSRKSIVDQSYSDVHMHSYINVAHLIVPFSHVVSFQCIKSRTICLRVKRRTGNKLGRPSLHVRYAQDHY